jgi:hypothetical protein
MVETHSLLEYISLGCALRDVNFHGVQSYKLRTFGTDKYELMLMIPKTSLSGKNQFDGRKLAVMYRNLLKLHGFRAAMHAGDEDFTVIIKGRSKAAKVDADAICDALLQIAKNEEEATRGCLFILAGLKCVPTKLTPAQTVHFLASCVRTHKKICAFGSTGTLTLDKSDVAAAAENSLWVGGTVIKPKRDALGRLNAQYACGKGKPVHINIVGF